MSVQDEVKELSGKEIVSRRIGLATDLFAFAGLVRRTTALAETWGLVACQTGVGLEGLKPVLWLTLTGPQDNLRHFLLDLMNEYDIYE